MVGGTAPQHGQEFGKKSREKKSGGVKIAKCSFCSLRLKYELPTVLLDTVWLILCGTVR